MKKIFKNHFIMTIGLFSFLMTFFARLATNHFDLQYDDGGIGTVLILGEPIYGFAFWLIAESFQKISSLSVYITGLLIFMCLDMIVVYCRKMLKFRQDKK
jgi:hypothetical protein